MISVSVDRKGDILVGSTVHISVNDQGIPQMPFHELVFEYIVSETKSPSSVHVIKHYTTSKTCVWYPWQEGEWTIKVIPKLRLVDGYNKKMAISCELHVPPATLQVNVIPRIKGKHPMIFTTNNPVTCLYTIPIDGLPKDTKFVRIALKKKPEPPKKAPGKKGAARAQANIPLRREEVVPQTGSATPNDDKQNEKNKENLEVTDIIEEENEEENGETVENEPNDGENNNGHQGAEEETVEEEEEEQVMEEIEGGNSDDNENENDNNNGNSEIPNEVEVERPIVNRIDGKYMDKKIDPTPFEVENNNVADWAYLRVIPTSHHLNEHKSVYVQVPNLEPKTVYQLKHQCIIVRSEVPEKPAEVPQPQATQPADDASEDSNNTVNNEQNVNNETGTANPLPPISVPPEQQEDKNNNNQTPRVKRSMIELQMPVEFMTDALKGKLPKTCVTIAPNKDIADKIIPCKKIVSSGTESTEQAAQEELIMKQQKQSYTQIIKNDSIIINPAVHTTPIVPDPLKFSLTGRKFTWNMRGEVNVLIHPVILDYTPDFNNILVVSRGEKDTINETAGPGSKQANADATGITSANANSSENAMGSVLSRALTHLSEVTVSGIPTCTVSLRNINEQLAAVGQNPCVSFGLDGKFLTSTLLDKINKTRNKHSGEIIVLCKQEHELPAELNDVLQMLFSKDSGNKNLNKELRSIMLQQRNIASNNNNINNNNNNTTGASSNRKSTNVNFNQVFGSEGIVKKEVSLITDLVIVLDSNMRLVWFWSAYDSIAKGEWESKNTLLGGMKWQNNPTTPKFKLCDPVTSSMFMDGSIFPLQYGYIGLDITGATTINEMPDMSGDILVSFMYQDSIMRIHREINNNEMGFGMQSNANNTSIHDGDIIWLLGPEGEFGILTENEAKKHSAPDRTLGPNSTLWWSHQQCAHIYPLKKIKSTNNTANAEHSDDDGENNNNNNNNNNNEEVEEDDGNVYQIVIFDSGSKVQEMPQNRRPNDRKTGNSRGIIININEREKVATIKAEIDLGFYSSHGGDAELVQDVNRDGTIAEEVPRYFFSGCQTKTGGIGKKNKKVMMLFSETTIMGDILWAGRIEADVSKVIRSIVNKSNATFSLLKGIRSSVVSPTTAYENQQAQSVQLQQILSTQSPSQSNLPADIKSCEIEVCVDNSEEAINNICSIFNLRRNANEATNSLQLVNNTTLLFTQKQDDSENASETCAKGPKISLYYNNREIFEHIRHALPESIESEVVESPTAFTFSLYGVTWRVVLQE